MSIVITEVMQNPSAVSDANGEWFEVFNSGTVAVDLNGWTISDQGVDTHTIAGSVLVMPGSYAVLGRNGDPATNGGVVVDYVYSGIFLANGDDEIILTDTNGVVADQIAYDGGPAWPDPNGASMALGDVTADNSIGANWAEATAAYGDGDLGTPGAANGGAAVPPKILLSEIVVTPTGGEFIEIHNPNGTDVDLSDLYLTDATFAGGNQFYYNLPTGSNAGGGGFGDFLARFPAGATIAAGEYQTIAIAGSDDFETEYGFAPDYELYEDAVAPDGVADMREGAPGSIDGQGGLTNSGEVVVLFEWDGTSDLVADHDYVVWGDKAEAVDKSGANIDGPDADSVQSSFAPDTTILLQEVVAATGHAIGQSFQRIDLTEGTQTATGGNGVTGADETSEPLGTTWTTAPVTPGAAASVGRPDLVINEIYADPAPDLAGDANGDGTRDSTDDEFVEIVNAGADPVNLSGMTLSDGFGIRHVFDAGTTLEPDARIVVFGGGTPTGNFGGAQVVTASSGALGLNNNGDTVTLADGTTVIDTVTYGSEGGQNQSVTRDPDTTGTDFVQHGSIAGAGLFSPGTEAGATPPASLRVSEVQGSGDASPVVGTTVTVEGVVTLVSPELRGFWMQDANADADGDAATSDGVFVFTGSNPTPDAGDAIRLTGLVQERFGQTQLTDASFDVLASGVPLPDAVVVELPLTGVTDVEAFYESLEGMRVSIVAGGNEDLVVTDTFTRFGEAGVTSGEILFQPTQVFESFSTEAENLAEANARDFIRFQNTIDDSLSSAPRAGDGIVGGSIDGVLAFSFGNYKVETDGAVEFDASVNPRPRTDAPEDVGGSLSVATFNVLNYFVTLDQSGNLTETGLNPRGAETAADLAVQTSKLVAALEAIDADIVGLVEIENDSGAATQALVDALNAKVGAGTYDFIDTGVVGGDAIKQAFIYKPAMVTPVGDFAVLDTQDFVNPLGATDSGGDLRDVNRPAIAQSWEENATGEVFTASVNHLKSKGSPTNVQNVEISPGVFEDDDGSAEGSAALTRIAAAQELSLWLDTNPTGVEDPDILILGDINTYASERAIRALEGEEFFGIQLPDVYTDLVEAFDVSGATSTISYAFSGEFGTLDYALANEPLLAQVTGTTAWNVNSLEAYSIQYDGGDFAAFGDANDPFASSDHDPIIVGLDLTSVPDPILLLGEADRNDFLRGGDDAEIFDGLGGRSDTYRGEGGNDVFVFTDVEGTRDALTILDYTVGEDRLDLGTEVIAGSTAFGNNLKIDLVGPDGDYVFVRGITDINDIEAVDGFLFA